jgi:dTDP-4-dehydrorhamnose reductase
MSKKKILIIGQKGLIGSNLFSYFKKKRSNVYSISFEKFLKKKDIKKFDIVINCTSNKKFIKNKYDIRNDNDLIIANKILDTKLKLIMISTRKIYKAKFNIKELDKKKPICNYSKNKLISEASVTKILSKRVLILRISNILHLPNNNRRKLHKTFSDIFFEMAKKGLVYKNKKTYKDFISIKKFNQIVFELVKKNLSGPFNVSLGKKIYIKQLIEWLNYYNLKKFKIVNIKNSFNSDNFTLNNNKLMRSIVIKNDINDLRKECLKMSKTFFS